MVYNVLPEGGQQLNVEPVATPSLIEIKSLPSHHFCFFVFDRVFL